MFTRFLSVTALSLSANLALASITIPSDGSDGAFNPVSNVTIDLGQASTASWDAASTQGKGIYDPAKWAVVFKYSSVNIPNGVTVKFQNHPSDAPVVWLVQGNVTVAGSVNLDGANATASGFAENGPGGFRGGRGGSATVLASPGFGPGGAVPFNSFAGLNGCGGSYATLGQVGGYGGGGGTPGPIYGNDSNLPLIGGSGGSGGLGGGAQGAGAGGGAILIASATTIQISGSVTADGGDGITYFSNGGGGGSGGAIRLVADTVTGSGTYTAVGGTHYAGRVGGDGRIRIDCNTNNLVSAGTPPAVVANAGSTPKIWPDSSAPSVTAVSVAGQAVPNDPRDFRVVPADVQLTTTGTVTVVVQTQNVPSNGVVTVRAMPTNGLPSNVNASFTGGNTALATWSAQVTLNGGLYHLQARAVLP